MIDVKCKGCDRLLAKATLMVAAIKCPRCKLIFEYRIYTNDLHENVGYGIKKVDPIEDITH